MKISGVFKKRILFLFFVLFSLPLFGQEISSGKDIPEEKITKNSFWESGVKFNIDTANLRLDELPKIARAIYFSTGPPNLLL